MFQSHLLSTWNSLKSVKNYSSDLSEQNEVDEPESTSQLSRIERLIHNQRKQIKHDGIASMEKKLRAIPLEDSPPLKTDIIMWWESKKNVDPNLVALCQTALSTPCTQVSIERGFSGLGKVLTNDRTKLSPEHLRMLLFIKLNGSLFKEAYLNCRF